MDNVTHSLAGLLLAEAAVRLRERRTNAEPPAAFRAVAALTAVAAANLPDADLLYSGVGGDGLAYMLHHRGHTHTLVLATVGAAVLWAAAMLAWRWRARPARGDAGWLFGLLLACALSHLVLDWTNSYGLHPFWPANNRWIYGDSVFIVEPWFWVATVPALVAARTNRVARALLSLVALTAIVLAWLVPLVSAGAAVALTAGLVLSVVLARTLRRGARVAAALAAWIAVTLCMAAGSAAARGTMARAVRAADPAAEVLDLVVTPLPATPVCATVITVERSGAAYRVWTARVSAAPAISPASSCRARHATGSTSRQPTRAVQWDSEWTAPHAELAALARESCPARAALRFLRVPVWTAAGDSVVLADARFGGGASGLLTVRVPRRSAACPAAVPPWTPPRAELIGWRNGE